MDPMVRRGRPGHVPDEEPHRAGRGIRRRPPRVRGLRRRPRSPPAGPSPQDDFITRLLADRGRRSPPHRHRGPHPAGVPVHQRERDHPAPHRQPAVDARRPARRVRRACRPTASLVPAAVEESLRHDPPIQFLMRNCTAATELARRADGPGRQGGLRSGVGQPGRHPVRRPRRVPPRPPRPPRPPGVRRRAPRVPGLEPGPPRGPDRGRGRSSTGSPPSARSTRAATTRSRCSGPTDRVRWWSRWSPVRSKGIRLPTDTVAAHGRAGRARPHGRGRRRRGGPRGAGPPRRRGAAAGGRASRCAGAVALRPRRRGRRPAPRPRPAGPRRPGRPAHRGGHRPVRAPTPWPPSCAPTSTSPPSTPASTTPRCCPRATTRRSRVAMAAVTRPLDLVLASAGLDETEATHWYRIVFSTVHGFSVLRRDGNLTLDADPDETVEMIVAMFARELEPRRLTTARPAYDSRGSSIATAVRPGTSGCIICRAIALEHGCGAARTRRSWRPRAPGAGGPCSPPRRPARCRRRRTEHLLHRGQPGDDLVAVDHRFSFVRRSAGRARRPGRRPGRGWPAGCATGGHRRRRGSVVR